MISPTAFILQSANWARKPIYDVREMKYEKTMAAGHSFCRASLLLLLLLLLILMAEAAASVRPDMGKGTWETVVKNGGVSAMHMQLLPNNKIIIFDRTSSGPSNISLPPEKCNVGKQEGPFRRSVNCTAHSVSFDVLRRTVTPLRISTDTWCSSGALAQDGTLVQTGGFGSGGRVVRRIRPVFQDDWAEQPDGLAVQRWYASTQILPDGRMIVVGGRRQFNYEFFPKDAVTDRHLYALPFLQETMNRAEEENNLYPFLHLAPDGNLFILANRQSILLNYVTNRVLRRYREMPGPVSRNYPSSGSSVLLPLRETGSAEIMVCGGAPAGAKFRADSGEFVPASDTCGRLRFMEPGTPDWRIETMPSPRVMGEMLLLPTGDVLIINGAEAGSSGWNDARRPVWTPVAYDPDRRRFVILSETSVARMYHSTAHVLPDGSVLVGGSNTHKSYKFSGVTFPTELRLQVFSPPYLSPASTVSERRPQNVSIGTSPALGPVAAQELRYGQRFWVRAWLPVHTEKEKAEVRVSLLSPAFSTHAVSMNQRLLLLDIHRFSSGHDGWFHISVTAPANSSMAPPGYYLLFVVHDFVPSHGTWVTIIAA